MSNPTTTPRRRKAKKGHPHPIRFDSEENRMIAELQDRTQPQMSVNDIMRRSLRFAVPKFLSGEAALTTLKPEGAPPPAA